jgi:chromosome segregation ATPase
MELGATLINTFVVLAVGIVLTYLTNDRFKAFRGEMDGLRGEMAGLRRELDGFRREMDGFRREMDGFRREMADFKAEVREDIARLEARIDTGLDAVRSDIVQVALAVGAKPRTAQA